MKVLIFHGNLNLWLLCTMWRTLKLSKDLLSLLTFKIEQLMDLLRHWRKILICLIWKASLLLMQAYDGAAVMRASINGVQVQMKKFFPHVHYIHCYAHQLNLIIKKMGSCNKRLKLFFSSLNEMRVFFTISPKRSSQLKKCCSAQIPRVCEKCWNYISRIISAVRSNREQILERFSSI